MKEVTEEMAAKVVSAMGGRAEGAEQAASKQQKPNKEDTEKAAKTGWNTLRTGQIMII